MLTNDNDYIIYSEGLELIEGNGGNDSINFDKANSIEVMDHENIFVNSRKYLKII